MRFKKSLLFAHWSHTQQVLYLVWPRSTHEIYLFSFTVNARMRLNGGQINECLYAFFQLKWSHAVISMFLFIYLY